MKVWEFDRWDFLVTRIALGLVIVAAPVFGVLLPFARSFGNGPLRWYGDTGQGGDLPSELVQTGRGGDVVWNGDASVSIPDPPIGLELLSLVPTFLGVAAATFVAFLLLRLLTRIQRGEPFVESSVRSLRLISVTVLIGGAVTPIANGIVNAEIMQRATQEASPMVQTDVGTIISWGLVALLIAAVAEAFAQGVRMSRDVEGLV
jgi:hypothetical protein